MTATNHMLTGALIALSTRSPFIALPLAFISHFALDALPHFGLRLPVFERNKHWLFRTVVVLDVLLAIFALTSIPFIASGEVSGLLVLGCMLIAFLPDVTWVYRFFMQLKTRIVKPKGRIAHFHHKIQWERPWGLITEVMWLGGTAAIIHNIV